MGHYDEYYEMADGQYEIEKKRLEQKKQSWIKNVQRILNLSKEKAEEFYELIQPFRNG